jgi:hypothetical protein
VLAAGGAAVGVLAIRAASDLAAARSTFPATRADLDQKASRVTVLGAVADTLGAAAIVAGGVSIYLTVASRGSVRVDATATWNSVSLHGRF